MSETPSETIHKTPQDKRPQQTSGKLGALVAAVIVVAALGYFLFVRRARPASDPTNVSDAGPSYDIQAAAKGPGFVAPRESHGMGFPGSSSESNPPPPDSGAAVGAADSNREKIIPGSNITPPAVDYSRNPPDASTHDMAGSGYGTDVNGGSAAPGN